MCGTNASCAEKGRVLEGVCGLPSYQQYYGKV